MCTYSQTELLLENCCWKNATCAQHGIDKPLRGVNIGVLFVYAAFMAFQIQFCLPITPSSLFNKFISSSLFQGITTFCHRWMGLNCCIYCILVRYFVLDEGCLSWFYYTKIINFSQ